MLEGLDLRYQIGIGAPLFFYLLLSFNSHLLLSQSFRRQIILDTRVRLAHATAHVIFAPCIKHVSHLTLRNLGFGELLFV